MAAKKKLRKTILDKIKKLSDDKLPNLDAYISDLESHLSPGKSTLSFSGIFSELAWPELTTELHTSREDNNDRIPQF